MRKLFFATCIMLAIITLSSCNNDDNLELPSESNVVVHQPDDLNALVAFNERLDSLNIVRFGTDNQTRGWLKGLWGGLRRLFKADAEGARAATEKGKDITGIIASAVCSSVIALFDDGGPKTDTGGSGHAINTNTLTFKGVSNAKGLLYTDRRTDVVLQPFTRSVCLQNVEKKQLYPTAIDSAGYYHNKIITNLFTKNNNVDYWKNLSKEEVLRYVTEETEKEFNLPTGTLQKQSANTLETLNSMADIDLYYNNLRLQNPKTAKTIDAISNYIDGINELDDTDDCVEYSNEIVKMIDESDMSIDDKKILYISFSVAFSSSRLWNAAVIEQ